MKLSVPFLLAIALFSVSTSSVIARLLPALPALAIAFWRMATASGILWGYSALNPQGHLSGTNTTKTVLAGIFLGLHFGCFFGALKLTTIANATVLATMAPVFTVLIEWVVFKRKLTREILLGLGLVFTGALFIQGWNLRFGTGSQLGNLLAILSSLWMAIVLLLAERIRQETATLVYSRWVYSIAGLALLIIVLFSNIPVLTFSARDFFWLGLLGLIPTVIGHTTFNYVVKFVRPTVVASVPLGEPIVASALGWIIFREPISINVLIGGGLILSGLYILTALQPVTGFQNDNL